MNVIVRYDESVPTRLNPTVLNKFKRNLKTAIKTDKRMTNKQWDNSTLLNVIIDKELIYCKPKEGQTVQIPLQNVENQDIGNITIPGFRTRNQFPGDDDDA